MLSKRTNGNNGYAPLPPALLEYVPAALQEKISIALDQEGQMNESAEQRILRAIAENHKELQGTIRDINDELHDHDTRLIVMEGSIRRAEKADETAASERADTKRLVKGSIIGIAILLAVTGVMGYYGLKAPAATPAATAQTEATQQSQQSSSDIKDLIKEIRQDREERKAESPAPANVPRNKPRTQKRPPGPLINFLRDGELITTDPWSAASLRHYSLSRGGL